jgi:hypothetical protein
LETEDFVQPPLFFFAASEAEAVFFSFPIARERSFVEASQIGGARTLTAAMAAGESSEEDEQEWEGVEWALCRSPTFCTVGQGDLRRRFVAHAMWRLHVKTRGGVGDRPSPH